MDFTSLCFRVAKSVLLLGKLVSLPVSSFPSWVLIAKTSPHDCDRDLMHVAYKKALITSLLSYILFSSC